MAVIIRTGGRRLLGGLPEGLGDIVLLWLALRIGLILIAAVLFVGGGAPAVH